MNVQDYIKIYENIVNNNLCDALMLAQHDFKSSSFSSHHGEAENSKNRVIMDDVWIKKDNNFFLYFAFISFIIVVPLTFLLFYLKTHLTYNHL